MNLHFKPNSLFYGDCLDIMRNFPDECIDLICLDPPFNSNEKYNSIFIDSGLNIEAQIKVFDDTWIWNEQAAARVEHIKSAVLNPASKVIAAFETLIPRSKVLSYTSYMAERLFQMWRILKPTGSIYLHCDPYASHYLKLVMDAIFGEKHFRNEIVWFKGFRGTPRKNRYQQEHDTLFFYSKTDSYVWNDIFGEYKDPNMRRYNKIDDDGKKYALIKRRRSNGEIYYGRTYPKGKLQGDVIEIPSLASTSKERLGYRTQKPIALYEQIVKASSNRNDIVLDPFCGCGTTIDAGQKNGRRVIGIDILPFALNLINERRLGVQLPVGGIPVDFETAQQLAKTSKGGTKFQDWAISLIDGLASNPKKVGDEGIDGFGMFAHKPKNIDTKAIIVQVTAASGSQNVKFDKLQNDVRKHNAAMGILITKDRQTAQHRWHVNLPRIEMGDTTYSPMQCFSIQEYYSNGKKYSPPLNLPPLTNPWTGKPIQESLFDAV